MARRKTSTAQRFWVWPAGTDSYSRVDLMNNWDYLDAIIGVPSSGTWPLTTGVDKGIYAEIRKAFNIVLPVGSIFAWFRPNNDIPIPDNCVICDGSTITDHNLPNVSGPIVVPDLRGRFILGANNNYSINTAAATVDSSEINTHHGAPGPQAIGGEDKVVLTVSQMPSHNHPNSLTDWSASEETWYDDNLRYPGSTNYEVIRSGSGHSIGVGAGGGGLAQNAHSLNDLSTSGSSEAHNNIPRYVGLLYLMKVK